MPNVPTTVPFEEAAKCPECGQRGKVISSRAVIGGTLHRLVCETELCPYVGMSFFVQVDQNGEVTVNEQAWKAARGQRLVAPYDPAYESNYQAVQEMMARQVRAETEKG